MEHIPELQSFILMKNKTILLPDEYTSCAWYTSGGMSSNMLAILNVLIMVNSDIRNKVTLI